MSVHSPGINDLSGEWYKTQPIYAAGKVANLLLFNSSDSFGTSGSVAVGVPLSSKPAKMFSTTIFSPHSSLYCYNISLSVTLEPFVSILSFSGG